MANLRFDMMLADNVLEKYVCQVVDFYNWPTMLRKNSATAAFLSGFCSFYRLLLIALLNTSNEV